MCGVDSTAPYVHELRILCLASSVSDQNVVSHALDLTRRSLTQSTHALVHKKHFGSRARRNDLRRQNLFNSARRSHVETELG